MAGWYTDKLAAWQAGILTSWQIGRHGRLTSWYTDKLTDWQAGRLTSWQIGRWAVPVAILSISIDMNGPFSSQETSFIVGEREGTSSDIRPRATLTRGKTTEET